MKNQAAYLEMITLLVDRGAEVDKRNNSPIGHAKPHETPLLLAARARNIEVMRLLVDQGADPSQGAFDGATALHVVAGVVREELIS